MGYHKLHYFIAQPRPGANKMVDLADAIQVVNALVVGLDSLTDASDINPGAVVLRLDCLHRMLVNLDVDQDIL